jgi:hypothetical protein
MALPENHPVNEVTVHAYTASIGASPVAAAMRAPFRGKIIKVGVVTHGVITTADSTFTFASDVVTAGTFVSITGGSVVATVSGAAASQHFSAVPTALNDVNEDTVIRATPSGASGASIPGTVYAVIRRA